MTTEKSGDPACTYAFDDLINLLSYLRDPKYGCPWDVAQTPETIVPYTIAEVYEVVEAIELKDWNGTGKQFYIKFAGDPKEGGFLHIRETGKPYTGKITAFDDFGRKEAVMRFKNGKYEGVISHWDENGRLVDEKEYERGKLITYTIKNGKAFDPNQVITLTEDNISMLFE